MFEPLVFQDETSLEYAVLKSTESKSPFTRSSVAFIPPKARLLIAIISEVLCVDSLSIFKVAAVTVPVMPEVLKVRNDLVYLKVPPPLPELLKY